MSHQFKLIAKMLVNKMGFDVRRIAKNNMADLTASQAEGVVRKNDKEAFELLYSDDNFLKYYLSQLDRVFYRALISEVKKKTPTSLIDVGCGPGYFLHECSKIMNTELCGAELTKSGVTRARELLPNVRIEQCSIYEASHIFKNKKFDLVCCIQVLEHLEFPDQAIVELIELKSETGKLFITVPDGRKDTWEGHINFWSDVSLRSFLNRWGDFDIRHIGTDLLAIEN